MITVKRVVVAMILAALGAACAFVDKGRLIAAEGVGRAAVVECGLSDNERKKNLDAINGWLIAEGYPHRAVAIDCDGDGFPDLGPMNLRPRM